MKILNTLLLLISGIMLLSGCARGNDYLDVSYLREGKTDKMRISLSIVEGKDRLSSIYIENVTAAVLDSITYVGGNPDWQEIHATPLEMDFTSPIKPYSPEYYAIYTVYCMDKAGEYYNRLFDGKIDFDSQQEHRSITVTFDDFPGLTTPKNFIFKPGSNPPPLPVLP